MGSKNCTVADGRFELVVHADFGTIDTRQMVDKGWTESDFPDYEKCQGQALGMVADQQITILLKPEQLLHLLPAGGRGIFIPRRPALIWGKSVGKLYNF